MERRQKTSGGNGRRLTLKEWLAKLMAVPLGRCLPEIALCMLVCCMLTGYIVLHLEQKEQYRQDTFEVYLQEHGQQDSTAQTEPEVTVPQKGVTTPPDEAGASGRRSHRTGRNYTPETGRACVCLAQRKALSL